MSNIAEHLISQGWREFPDQFRPYARAFYKQFDTPTRCFCNNDKEGIQVCLYLSEYMGNESIELSLTGEASNGVWVKIEPYSFKDDLAQALNYIPTLLAGWEVLSHPKQ